MTLGEQRRKALELLAPPPSRHDHSDGGIPRQSGQRFEQAFHHRCRSSGCAVYEESDVNAEAGRAQTLQDARKPMHTDPSTIWVIPYQRTTEEHIIEAVRIARAEAERLLDMGLGFLAATCRCRQL